jgi:DNA-binding NarL/FixJ family response regulator
MRTQILLADDHQLILDGVKALLAPEPDLAVVGEATDGTDALAKAIELKPEIMLLDLTMPGLNGLEVARLVHERAPSTKVIVLSMHANDAYVVEAMRHGARGYVLKQAATGVLVDAIRAVRGGARYLSPPLSEEQLERWERDAGSAPIDPYDTLSAREREVLQLAAEGLTSAEIGDKLHIGKRTVETHRANLQRKMGLKSHADLIRLALKKGLVTID